MGRGSNMLMYLVERVYHEASRPGSVMSVWSSLDRAQAWAERNHFDDGESHIAIRVQEVDISAAAS